jgi:myo-inositol-1(or 4)-monophosphatase
MLRAAAVPRYAILEHDWPARHWDLFLEAGGVLRAWRLLAEPTPGATVPAEPAADHRLTYLDYEGPVSGNRGTVTRRDSGVFEWIEDRPGRIVVELNGLRLRGRAEVAPGHIALPKLDGMTLDLPDCLDVAKEAARRGAAVLESWRGRFTAREKGRADLVSEADHASQDAVKAYLLGRFPHHHFLGEEEAVGKPIEATRPAPGSPPTWVVDPLDGTANYVHGVPAYCVSIGLWADGKPVVGVVYDPRLDELFAAAAGHGATLNGKPMRVSTVSSVRDGMIGTGFPASYQGQLRNLEVWRRVSAEAQSLRRNGSSALSIAYVAAGRFDGYWAFDNWAWDVCAGAVLVAEAGGRVTGSAGGPFDPFRHDSLITNGLIHEELGRLVNS